MSFDVYFYLLELFKSIKNHNSQLTGEHVKNLILSMIKIRRSEIKASQKVGFVSKRKYKIVDCFNFGLFGKASINPLPYNAAFGHIRDI